MSATTGTPWEVIEAHLIRSGVISPDGTTRRAQPRRCTRCKAPILVGLDADRCALRADVDPWPLAPLGEALAQLAGRRTYTLSTDGARLVLDYRDAGRITTRPAGTGRWDVYAEHRHYDPIPAALCIPSFITPPTPGSSTCPF